MKFLIAIRAVLMTIVTIFTIIAVIVLVQRKLDERPFTHYDFPDTMTVSNSTDYKVADTLSLYLAHKVLAMDTINLIFAYIPEHINEGDMEYYAFVQQLPFKKNQFLILLDREEMSLSMLKKVLAHEFIHIDQYVRGDIVIYPGYAIWKGEDIYFGEVDYKDRPFEQEALKLQGKVKRELNKHLYH